MKYKNIPLTGTLHAHEDLPGDKSISHRALIFAALAQTSSRIYGLNTGEDVLCTKKALNSIGVDWTWHDHILECHGRPHLWLSPPTPINLGNSGTSARLLTGLLACLPLTITFTGDDSLKKRPMGRVIEPLRQMGAQIHASTGLHLPIHIQGGTLKPIHYRLNTPSAQIKSALLLAALLTPGTSIIEGALESRDHTEKLMGYLNIPLSIQPSLLKLTGPVRFQGGDFSIPADPSAAAFFAVAALITPGSRIRLTGISWNPYRNQVFHVLQQMGGRIRINNHRVLCGEPVADIEVYASHLHGIETAPEQAPKLIDEFPILSIAAACANGQSIFRGLAELRVKESNRLHGIAHNLQKCGYQAFTHQDDLYIHGQSSKQDQLVVIEAQQDHRLAMSFHILNLIYRSSLIIDDDSMIKTSFPNFLQCFDRLI